ncbi:helix-turn-helix domain-containing protein [uncultured Albimonas sp.]|uniref:AraC family transcriptional regulator n=1 Tax=uncultured Albimonas sp. TaxID=1331701 RepID=UPI0030EF231D|tara:strand:+ start:350 stop:1270 length:921 start_codon:yes stop_codon:yes gene_type:complete
MFPVVDDTRTGPGRDGRDVVFDHVEHFALTDPEAGRLVTSLLPLEDLGVFLVRSTGHDIALSEPERTTFIAPLDGVIEVEGERSRARGTPCESMLLQPGYRRTRVRPPEAGGFAAIAVITPAGGGGAALPTAQLFARGAHAAADAMAGYLRYFAEAYAPAGSPLRRPPALRATRALLLDFFADMAAGADPDRAPLPLSERRVREAEEIILARHDEPLSIAGVARSIGVSSRALQLAFQDRRGISPRAHLNRVRLEAARLRLLTAGPAERVTDIALACGFTQFGRFSVVYRETFGERPSDTLRRAGG